ATAGPSFAGVATALRPGICLTFLPLAPLSTAFGSAASIRSAAGRAQAPGRNRPGDSHSARQVQFDNLRPGADLLLQRGPERVAVPSREANRRHAQHGAVRRARSGVDGQVLDDDPVRADDRAVALVFCPETKPTLCVR